MRHRTVLLLAFALFAVPLLAGAATHNVSVGPGNAFSPANVNINVGDTVLWTRVGGTHSVTADDGSFTSPSNSSWTTFPRTFNAAGVVEYFCDVHSSPTANFMNGTVTVTGGGGGNAGTLQFSTDSTSVNENAGTRTITVTRTGGDDGAVSVEYETADGSATFPGDYTQTNDTLNWADNDDNPKTFTVPIINDSTEEPNQAFTIHLQNATGATIGGPNTITVTINDDDAPTGSPGNIRFVSATATVSEGQANVTLSVERVGGSSGAVSAEVDTANGSATAGADYQAISNEQVSWGNGDTAVKTVVVPIVGDTAEEPSETFSATLSAPTNGASIGNIPTTTVTITDDDVTCTPCLADANTLCLAGGSGDPARFRVRVNWTDFAGNTGAGKAVPFTPDAGFFYFFNNPNNLELLVKMVRGCGTAFDAYWFFYAAASNVGLEYEVLDTTRCVTKNYSNPVGNFASFGDIAALATCP